MAVELPPDDDATMLGVMLGTGTAVDAPKYDEKTVLPEPVEDLQVSASVGALETKQKAKIFGKCGCARNCCLRFTNDAFYKEQLAELNATLKEKQQHEADVFMYNVIRQSIKSTHTGTGLQDL